MWWFLILLGVVLLIAAGIVWLAMTGRIPFLAKKFGQEVSPGLAQRVARLVEAETAEALKERPAEKLARRLQEKPAIQIASDLEMPISTRLAHLQIGNVVKVETIDGQITGEVESLVIHHELYKIRDDWRPTGDTFIFAQLTGGQWLRVRDTEINLFTETRHVTDGEIAAFKEKAKTFGQQDQRQSSVQVSYQGTSFDLVDIGTSRLEAKGQTAVSGQARFILAESSGGQVLWVEERRDGPDVIMLGGKLMPSDISDIL
ncbi:MAG: DUF4178 domain-containing protein [Candidatus Marinimicrobia bacterium]|nr:DUF4178 domain-containing protein [Candidatus Neomarinimicrobiota bacterium]